MSDPLNLGGKRVLVFGGTRKIGRAVGLAYADAGARVAVTGRDPESGAAMVKDMSSSAYRLDPAFRAKVEARVAASRF